MKVPIPKKDNDAREANVAYIAELEYNHNSLVKEVYVLQEIVRNQEKELLQVYRTLYASLVGSEEGV